MGADHYTDVNRSFERIFGYKAQEIRGKSAADSNLWQDQVERQQIWNSLLQQGGLRDRECRFRSKSGEILHCRLSAEIVEMEELPDEDLQYVIDLIHTYDGIGYTRNRAKLLVESAKDHLAGFADCPAKEAMTRLADYIVSRSH